MHDNPVSMVLTLIGCHSVLKMYNDIAHVLDVTQGPTAKLAIGDVTLAQVEMLHQNLDHFYVHLVTIDS